MRWQLNALDLFRNVSRSTKQGGLIGLNVGTTYIGVAVSDFKFQRASPHCVLTRNDNNVDEMALELQRVITTVPGLGLIIGIPYSRGRMHTSANQVQRLTSDLSNTITLENVPFAYWEEGFTSKLAKCVMHPFTTLDPRMEKIMSHKVAATGMLQEYLDAANNAMGSDLQDSSDEDEELG